jgi:hypothetical protein
MTSFAHPIRDLPTAGFAVLGAAVATAAALVFLGPFYALGLVGLLVGATLFVRPRLMLGVYLGAAMLAEIDEQAVLAFRTAFYDGRPAPSDIMLALLVAGTVTELVARRRAPRLPGAFTLPLALLALAMAAGAVNGYFSGGEVGPILDSLRGLSVLVVLPVVLVNLVDDATGLKILVAGAAVLASVRGAEGLTSWLAGEGRVVGTTTLTFYSPGPNLLLLLFLLGVLAAAAVRVRLPLWVYVAAPVCLAAFVLSFRRNFWIAGVISVGLLLLIGSGIRGRRILAVSTAALALGVYAVIAVADVPELERPIAERVSSLEPSRIRSERYDRYRLDEARNVVAEIRDRPLAGIGLGVPWQARHPLPVEFEGGRLYTHVTPLWYWLKLGVLGIVAYVALLLTAVATAFRIGRMHPEPLIRVGGTALASGLVGLAIAETTGAFTGISEPLTILVAACYGWLAAAHGDLRRTV